MDGAARLDEPVVDRHEEGLASTASSPRKRSIGPSFFTLSGGILKRDPRTSNRIDSMLTRMLEDGPSTKYRAHIDKNLDYLHTSLQLDMISMVALESSIPSEEGIPRDEAVFE